MDSIFGIGLPELIVIAVIAGLVMGPQRIAVAARWLGKTTSQLRRVSRTFLRQLNAELSAADSDGQLRETYDELQLLRQQVNELRHEVTSVTRGTLQEGQQAIDEARAEVENLIAPPSLRMVEPKEPSTVRPPSLSYGSPSNGQSKSDDSTPDPPTLPSRIDVPEDPE